MERITVIQKKAHPDVLQCDRSKIYAAMAWLTENNPLTATLDEASKPNTDLDDN
jgi:hypothetical protein